MKKSHAFSIAVILASMLTYNCYSFLTRSNSTHVLEGIFSYDMRHITARCQKDYNYNDEDIILLEQELKRFLALAAMQGNYNEGIGMYSADIDNLWHTFILFTHEYATFCQKYAGFFIHHEPETEKPKTQNELRAAHQRFLTFIETYEKTFNEKAHDIWFLDMCT